MEGLKPQEEMAQKKRADLDMVEQMENIQMDTQEVQEEEATMVVVALSGTQEEEEVHPSYQVMMDV